MNNTEKDCKRCMHGHDEECSLPEYGAPCDDFVGDAFWDRANLRAELAELQKDSERYRWVRDNIPMNWTWVQRTLPEDGGHPSIWLFHPDGQAFPAIPDKDAAVDSAMK